MGFTKKLFEINNSTTKSSSQISQTMWFFLKYFELTKYKHNLDLTF